MRSETIEGPSQPLLSMANLVDRSPLREALERTYYKPFLELVYEAQTVHRAHHPLNEIQLCTLSNIKSGNCPEDCKYCPQSAHYKTEIDTWGLPSVAEILTQAKAAKANGSTRFCMGAAWRTPPAGKQFEEVLAMVRAVAKEDLEVCVTLGMLTDEQAIALKKAGLTAYNHNIDTGASFYPSIITTRTLQDRLSTLETVAQAGIQVCCGGILGMGETVSQRLEMVETLCSLETPPESVPVNCLVPVAGTPMEAQAPLDAIELVRTLAVIRIFLPTAKIRLSAGRLDMQDETQALCFLAGANAIFTGDVLLTTPNPGANRDAQLMAKLGLIPQTLPQPKVTEQNAASPLLA